MRDGQTVVLLTGANGFVGRNLAPALTANGMLVRRATRSPSPFSDSVTVGALGPKTDWSTALSNVKAVVHLAARAHRPNEENSGELYRLINTEGTLHLARCASEAGVRQFVFLSSILVNGASTDGRPPFREVDPVSPRGVYGFSKAAAEAGLETFAQETDMKITVIRPPLIYGPGALGNFRLLAKAVERGIPLPFGSINNRRAFLSVANLASFTIHQLAHPPDKFNVFLVADEEQVSTPEFARRIARALDKSSHIVPLPLFALRAIFKIIKSGEAYDSVVKSLEIDPSKSLQCGWRPRFSLDEGLASALQTTDT